jgi:hypothetical protein
MTSPPDHQEDICQALGVSPDRRYQRGGGGPGAARIVALFRQHQTPAQAEESVETFCCALAFNWAVYGPDAHAKNDSLLLSGAQVRLAPMLVGICTSDLQITAKVASDPGVDDGPTLARCLKPQIHSVTSTPSAGGPTHREDQRRRVSAPDALPPRPMSPSRHRAVEDQRVGHDGPAFHVISGELRATAPLL